MESRVPQHIPGVSSSTSSSSSSSSIMVQPLLDSRVPYGRLQHPLTIYPIDQMKSSHVENDYIDSPAAVCQQPQLLSHNHSQHQHPPLPKHHLPTAASTGSSSTTTTTGTGQHHHHNNHNHNHHHSHSHQHLHHHHHHHHHQPHTQDSTHPWISFSGRPSSISSSSSTSSDQRLLDHAAPTPVQDTVASNTSIIITSSTTTTTSSSSSSLPLAALSLGQAPPTSNNTGGGVQAKLLQLGSSKPVGGTDLKGVLGGLDGRDGSLLPGDAAKHLLLCERCGKCRCTECTLPRALPSCWVCHQACLCSAQSLVDAATCMCLVKGVFYHCAEDEDGEEGSCADRPCSCGPSHRCARWSFMAVLSLALPCLLCYLPAVGCAKLSQKCYDGARRPGCRCKAKVPAATTTTTTAVSSKAGMPAGIGIVGKPVSGGIIGALDKQVAS